MPSLRYRTELQFIRWFGHKRVFGLPEPELRRWLTRHAESRPLAVPRFIRAAWKVRDQEIYGRPCPIISPALPRANAPVVLFLHGGGFIFEALFVHWLAVDRLIRRTGAEVWFAAYPLLPQATIYESHEMVYAVWQQMCERYAPSRIRLLGDSAGAILALTLTHDLRTSHASLPRQLVLASPAQTLQNEEIRKKMRIIAPKDALIPLSLLDVLPRLMPERPHTPSWMMRPLEGNFTDFPKTMVLSGTREVFYPLMPAFIERLKGAGVETEFISGTRMCHVWPYIPGAPECVRTLNYMINALK